MTSRLASRRMRIWSTDEEAKRLAARFAHVNRSGFAREYKMPGGPEMIYQHLQAMRPISMEAAIVYARGFGVRLSEISPRLAKVAMNALGVERIEPDDRFAALHRLPEEAQAAILVLAHSILGRQVRKRAPA